MICYKSHYKKYNYYILWIIYFQIRLQMVYTRNLSHKNISVHKQEKYKDHSYTANALKKFSCFCRYTQMYSKKHLLNKTSYNLHNIEYNYCICVYIYPEEFLSNDRDYSIFFFFQFISGPNVFVNF